MNTTTPHPKEYHHRRIQLAGVLIWAMLFFFFITGLSWLYWRILVCSGESDQGCENTFLIPLAFPIIVLALFLFMLLELRTCCKLLEGEGILAASPHQGLRLLAHHTQHGYKTLPTHHKKHIRWAMIILATKIGALAGFWMYYLELPALAAILTGLLCAVLAFAADRIWLHNTETPAQ